MYLFVHACMLGFKNACICIMFIFIYMYGYIIIQCSCICMYMYMYFLEGLYSETDPPFLKEVWYICVYFLHNCIYTYIQTNIYTYIHVYIFKAFVYVYVFDFEGSLFRNRPALLERGKQFIYYLNLNNRWSVRNTQMFQYL
jgi:hypothetical protein